MPVTVKSYVAQGALSLEVIVGQAQLGHITAFLNDTKLVETWNRLPVFPLGKATDLKGKVLTISTLVLDIQPATDLTNVFAQLTDSPNGPGLMLDEHEESQSRLPTNYFYVVRFQ